jgi:hypothetical protein
MSGRVSAALTAVDPEARWRIGVVAKRTFKVANGKLVEAPEQLPLAEEPVLSEDGLTLVQDIDLILRKERTDVVVLGHAYPHEGDRRGRVVVRVEKSQRDLSVFGERKPELKHDGRLVFSTPEPFEKVPLGWESAYGGYDAAALEAYGDPTEQLRKDAGVADGPEFGLYSYPRNPAGRGYLVEITHAALEGCSLPQIEDPRFLLAPERLVAGNSLAWPAGPLPASTAFLPYSFFPRMSLLGFPVPLYDAVRFPPASFIEAATGLISESSLAEEAHVATLFDRRGLQCSAPGMRWDEIAPGVEIELRGVHPRVASWRFRLNVRPPSMYSRVGAERPLTLKPEIKTVVIEPDEERLSLLWVGEAPMDLPLTPEQLETVQHAVMWS